VISPPPRSATAPADLDPPARHPEAPAPGSVLPSHYHRCVACGPEHPTGLRIVTTAGEGATVTGGFTVTAEHQGAPGLAHGGVLATALDEVLGSLAWLLRKPMVTGRLETDMVRPVPVGTILSLRAECLGFRGRRMYASATGRIGGPDGSIAIRAAAVFVVVPVEHFTEHDNLDHAQHEFEVNP